MMACLDACGIQNQITDTGIPGKLKLLAAKLAGNPILSRTFLMFCSLTPQYPDKNRARKMGSPHFNLL